MGRMRIFTWIALFALVAGLAGPASARMMRGGRMGGQGVPGLIMGKVLEEAGCPLEESQVTALKELERGPGMRDRITGILTDTQKAALKSAREEHAVERDKEGWQGRRSPGRIMAKVLEDAGCPLGDSQIAAMKDLERGPGIRDRIMDILTDTQKSALEAARAKRADAVEGRRGGRVGRGRKGLRFRSLLGEAGCPLTKEQIGMLRELPRGADKRAALESILTPGQLTVLENTRGQAYGDVTESAGLAKPVAVGEETPGAFNLIKQNYPNPFNPVTTIDYHLAQTGTVRVDIYSPGGQLVETLVDGGQSAGWHSAVWKASSNAAGIYLCRITANDYVETIKMTLVK
ncbi:MAG: T9SS type A sorting domain-containing protein [Candidatus Latescibacteria bacterium]|nr:T9SS type A sorting domain-containing protein [Candidatus Latescibacterota bacterium]